VLALCLLCRNLRVLDVGVGELFSRSEYIGANGILRAGGSSFRHAVERLHGVLVSGFKGRYGGLGHHAP
jgi:hypothetical protein